MIDFTVMLLLFVYFFALRDVINILYIKVFCRKLGACSNEKYYDIVCNCARTWLCSGRMPNGREREPFSWVFFQILQSPMKYFRPSEAYKALVFGWLSMCLVRGNNNVSENVVRKIEGYLSTYFSRRKEEHCYLAHEAYVAKLILICEDLLATDYSAKLHEMINSYKEQCSASKLGVISYHPGSQHVLVDSIAMLCPVLMQYGLKHDPACVGLSLNQLDKFLDYGVEKRTGLVFHGYEQTHMLPLGLIGWGRGMGWFLIGLIDTVSLLSNGDIRRAQYAVTIKRYVELVLSLECPEGGWRALLTDSAQIAESSATAMIGYYLARCIDEGFIVKEVGLPAVERSISFLKKYSYEYGAIGNTQGDCLGLDRMSRYYAPNVYSLGPTILLLRVYFNFMNKDNKVA